MKISDLLSISVNNLLRQKLRASLTLLGIILGTISVSITLAMSNAIKSNNQKILDTKGDLKTIDVDIDYQLNETKSDKEKLYMDDNAINKLKKIDGVDGMWFELNINNANVFATKGNKYVYFNNIQGINMDDIDKFGYELLEGTIPKEQTLENKKYVPVLAGQYFEYCFLKNKSYSESYYNRFRNRKDSRYENSPWEKHNREKYNRDIDSFIPKPPFVNYGKEIMRVALPLASKNISASSGITFSDNMTGQIISDDSYLTSNNKQHYKYYNLNVSGRLNWEKVKNTDDRNLPDNSHDAIFVNIDIAKELIKEMRTIEHKSTIYADVSTKEPLFTYNNVQVKVKDLDLVQDVTSKISKLGFSPKNKIDEVKKEQSRTKSNQLVLSFLGAITLFVSSLSVANTMITSMYERTKEIGVMKVIGCKIGNIQIIFLIESAILGLIGGTIGMTVTHYISNFINSITDVADTSELTGIAQLLSTYMEMMKYDNWSTVKLDIALVDTNLWFYIILGSTLVTIIAGYLPSRRASRISALSAIKDE